MTVVSIRFVCLYGLTLDFVRTSPFLNYLFKHENGLKGLCLDQLNPHIILKYELLWKSLNIWLTIYLQKGNISYDDIFQVVYEHNTCMSDLLCYTLQKRFSSKFYWKPCLLYACKLSYTLTVKSKSVNNEEWCKYKLVLR